MAVDLTKIVQHSNYPTFKNNSVYTGTLSFYGELGMGTNTRSWTVSVPAETRLLDVYFSGASGGARPSNAMFKSGQGFIFTETIDGYGAYWRLNYGVTSPGVVTIYAYCTRPKDTYPMMTTTNFNYKIVDFTST